MFEILLVEDDDNLRNLYKSVLVKEGFTVHDTQNGEDALSVFEYEHIDLVICDTMMPKMDGYELVEALRSAYPFLPVLMITVLGELENKEKAFKLGVDDYMVKPINIKELVMRISALLRRSQGINEKKLKIGDTCLNYNQMEAISGGKTITLTPKEFKLLYKLFSYPNHVFTKFQLMDEVWGVSSESGIHTLEVYIGKLRERFKANKDFKIVTIRGLGYKVVAVDD